MMDHHPFTHIATEVRAHRHDAGDRSIESLVGSVLDTMRIEPIEETDISIALGALYDGLDKGGRSKTKGESGLICWNAWYEYPVSDNPVSDDATPWLAFTLNLLYAYGEDMSEGLSDPTGCPTTLRALFEEDEILSAHIEFDRSAFKSRFLNALTPRVNSLPQRRSL